MQQSQALEILKTGANVFLTGEAGSGKTYVLNQYQEWLDSVGLTVAVTGSTGIAATHLGGRTIHSWSGIGIMDKLDQADLDRLFDRDDLVDRVRGTDVLIIDEVSMISHLQLDAIDQVLRRLRQSPAPFGGMQVIVSGDFFQLPPIGRGSRLIVMAEVWTKASFAVCYLVEQWRSEGDSTLAELLSAIRASEVEQQHFEWLTERLVTQTDPDSQAEVPAITVPEGITRLYTHNEDVDKLNLEKLKSLPGSTKTFTATHTGNAGLAETMVRNSLIEHKLKLKPDAEVMFIKNDPEGEYVNGTRGQIVSVNGIAPRVRLQSGKVIQVRPLSWTLDKGDSAGELTAVKQVPLRLAWAVTIHKSQGMTLDAAAIDLSRVFTPGQGYVALSRLKSLSGLYLLGISNQALAINPDIVKLDGMLRQQSTDIVSHLESHSGKELESKQKNFVQSRGGKWL